MKKSLLFLALFFISSITITTVSAAPLRIGAVLPLTGAFADFGSAAKNGMELARRDYADSLKNVEFLYEDSKSDNVTALSIFNQWRNTHTVDLVYVWGYAQNQVLVPLADSARIPLVAVTAERGITKGREFALRFCSSADRTAEVLLKFLRKKKLKRILLLQTDQPFLLGVKDGLLNRTASDEKIEVNSSFLPHEIDFNAVIAKLKRKEFDALGVLLMNGQIAPFFKQAAALSFLPGVVFGTHLFGSPQEIRIAAGAMNGAVFPAPWVEPRFIGRYEASYGTDAHFSWAANAYEFTALLSRQLQKTSPMELFQSLKHVPEQHGVVGTYSYEDGDGFDLPVEMKKIEGNTITPLS